MDERVYWIWLQHALGAGSPKPWVLHRRFSGGVREFWQNGPRLWNAMEYLSEQEAGALYSFSLEEAEAQLEYADKVGWNVITPECEKYPEALRNICDPPAVLYLKGKLPDVDRMPAIAVAGARKALKQSEDMGKSFGFQLAAGGAAVVSGGAVGIDSAVLMGAMSAMGPTVSVLPVALNSAYLTQNAFLREAVVEKGGCLASEYFSQQSPALGGFQVRNRLISGLSCGVLLIQAGLKSGTMIYARHAKEQDRDLYVYPGPEGAKEYEGSRSLLEDGAKAVTCGEEILAEYAQRFQKNRRVLNLFETEPSSQAAPVLADSFQVPELTAEKRKIMEAVAGETLSVSRLEERTGLSAAVILGLLTELELDGYVISCPGMRYRRS